MKYLLKKIFKKKAFTLVEFLISLSIISMMLIISFDIMMKLTREAEKNDIRAELDRTTNFAFETVKRNIRNISSNGIRLMNCGGGTCKTCLTASCNGCQIGDKVFYYAKNADGYGRIYQRDTKNTSIGDVDMTGAVVDISEMYFEYSDGFVQITAKVYDTRKVVYPFGFPLVIVTGAVVRVIN